VCSSDLPVFGLLGQQTLTFESWNNAPSAETPNLPFPFLSFAEMNPSTSFNLSVGANYPICIAQTKSGSLLVVSSLSFACPNGTNVGSGATINNTVWWSRRVRYVNDTIDWTIYVGVPWSDVYGPLQYALTVAGVGSMVFVLACGVGMFALVYFCVSRALQKNTYSQFSDISRTDLGASRASADSSSSNNNNNLDIS
jgi:hypothetical protein